MQPEGSLPCGVLGAVPPRAHGLGRPAPRDPGTPCLCLVLGGRFCLHAPACHGSLEGSAVFLCSHHRLHDSANKGRPRWRWPGLFLGTGVCASPSVCGKCGHRWGQRRPRGQGRVPGGRQPLWGPCLRWHRLLCPLGGMAGRAGLWTGDTPPFLRVPSLPWGVQDAG